MVIYSISIFLLCNLLFTQVLIGFFHNHTAETACCLKKEQGDTIKKETPKCKLCALDTIHELYTTDFFVFTPISKPAVKCYLAYGESVKKFSVLFVKGRAPPVISLLS